MNTLYKYFSLAILFTGAALLVSCEKGKAPDSSLAEKHAASSEPTAPSEPVKDSAEATEASYDPVKGLLLVENTKKNLGLEFSRVQEESVVPTVPLTAQVYRSAQEVPLQYGEEKRGFAYATVMITPELSKVLKSGQKLEFVTKQNPSQRLAGAVWKVNNSDMASLQKTEVLLELSDSDAKLQVGDFVNAAVSNDSSPKKALSVPRSAVLQASHGAFVFLQKGNFLLRVPVKTGVQNDNFVEIVEGLGASDVVLSKPVEAVYLIELRFVKGGAQAD